ncbi:IS110 family transposase [Catalinimonas sp. 4WD22]|uniref:IS110 family transposase n=1 Tax=Catalinimonas locisalis TaxID=3133978 RepID=UPI003101A182
MKNFTYQVGIDVAKDTLDCTLLKEGQKLHYDRIDNNAKAVSKYIKYLEKQDVALNEILFCMEHTGVYNAHILQFLIKKKYSVCLEAAIRIKKTLGFTRGKNDEIDSYRIARYAYLHQDGLRLWVPRREVVQQLAHLTTLRKRLLKTKTALQQPLGETKRFLNRTAYCTEKAITNPVVKSIDKQQKQVEKQIKKLIQEDETLHELFELVTSVDAVGPVTASHMLVVTNEFKNFNCPKKFSCYAGTAPFENSSGSSIRGKSQVSPYANKESKKLLHMVAMSAINMKNSDLEQYYQRKVQEGKNKMSVINAVRNKIIKRIFACVRDNRKYEKNYIPVLA